MIDPTDRVFFRDVYDHLVRLVDLTDSLRDLVTGAMETYLSVMNNRMNDVMKTLTIITTLFMPLSFVTGFFGMNFFASSAALGEWTSALMFSATLGAMFILPLTMLLWMRHRAWM
jgi:magnesium transporter